MKRIIMSIIMMLFVGVCFGQTYTKVDNNTYQAVKVTKTRTSTYQPTGKYYIEDSVKYEIHIHTTSKGKNAGQTYCYIQKVSKKTGKPYWKKIDVKPEELK